MQIIQPESHFSDEDRAIIEDFSEKFLPIAYRFPTEDAQSVWKQPVPDAAINSYFKKEELVKTAESLERGILWGVNTIETTWYDVGRFLLLLSRANLFQYLPGEPRGLHAWVTLRDNDFKDQYQTIADSPLMKSYNLLNQYRNVYRDWIYKIAPYAPDITQYLRHAHNRDILQIYSEIVDSDEPENAVLWAKDAMVEKDKERARRKKNKAIEIAKQEGVSPSSVPPEQAEGELIEEEQQYPQTAFLASKIKKEWRGDIPRNAWIEDEVIPISPDETHVIFRRARKKGD